MASIVNILGALTTSLCAALLLIAHARVKQSLLLFSGLCFIGLALSNLLRFVDLVILPDIDLFPWRLGLAIAGMALLLYDLIWNRR